MTKNEAASVAQGLDGWTIKRHEDGWIFFKRPDDFRQSVTPEESMGSHAQTLHMLLDALLAQAAPHAAPVQGDALTRWKISQLASNFMHGANYRAFMEEIDALLAAPAAPTTLVGMPVVVDPRLSPGEFEIREAASQPGEMGAGVAHELQFILNVMEDVKAGLETKAVHRITLGKAIEKARALLLAAPCDASPTSPLHKFLNAAAGEGLVLDGVDAADLYIATFPKEYEAQSAQIVTRATSAQQEMGAGVDESTLTEGIWQRICELPDRSSPENEPDACVLNRREFEGCVANTLEDLNLLAPQGVPAASAQQDEREAYCKACDGAGTVSTGISEASSTQCRKCDGTGVMQQDERKTVIGTALGGGNLTHSDCSGANCHICGGTGMPKKGEVLAQQVQADAGAVANDKRDAERYRWLREEAQYFAYGRAPSVVLCDENDMFEKGEAGSESGFISGKKLDDAIDAAMSREQSQGRGREGGAV